MTLVTLAAAAMVSACSQSDGGSSQRAAAMSQMRSDAMPFDQARTMCWERAWGAPGGGQGAENAKHAAYMACMGQAGWQDQRHMF